MIFWTGDAPDVPLMAHFGHPQLQKNLDLTWCVSEWQRRKYIETSGLNSDKVLATRNGFAPFLLKTSAAGRRWRDAGYTSTPFRGLDILLKVFPEMRRQVPDLRLNVWSSMQVYNWSEAQDRRVYGSLYEAAAQPGVSWHGGVPQPELLKHLGSCGLLLYPNTYEETSCIAAIEAQASGMVVVTTARAALVETVQHNITGLCLEGDPTTDDYQRSFIAAVKGLLDNPDRLQTMSDAACTRARTNYSWTSIAREWISILEALPAEEVPRNWNGPLLTLPDPTAADLADYALLLQRYGIRYPVGTGTA
jgi:glycosyltransferase involved in cell wall biosynthesis